MDIFKRSRRRKSGSLQLSINAIVILVMAMVVLGLGLTFIRGLFSKGTENLGSVLDNTRLENPANAEDVMTIDRVVTTSKGKTVPLEIGFYNKDSQQTVGPTGSQGNYDGEDYLNCVGGGADNQVNGITLNSMSATVNSGEAKGFEALVSVDDDVPIGTYICTVRMVGGDDGELASKQFRLEVVG
ncbi:MAG: hypothetical protein ACLFO2_02850 [Candidatus Woesearchaeota archaeon]